MSEFSPSEINNDITSIRLLTNISKGPIILNAHDSILGYIDSSLVERDINIYFNPDESIFYRNFLVSDIQSTLYNQNKLDSYVKQGILSDSYFTPLPPSISVTGITNNTHSLAFSTSGNIIKTPAHNTYNHLSLSYVLDSSLDKIKLIVYRDTDGMSYSTDGGMTCIKIPNTNLLYPNEITSFVIQAHTNISVTVAKSKIFIGTLREGLKSFTIDLSSGWEQEGADEHTIVSGTNNYFSFKHSITNLNKVKASDGIVYDYVPSDFAPCYVLTVNNYPITAGNGILVAVNSKIIDTFSVDIPLNSGTSGLNTITNNTIDFTTLGLLGGDSVSGFGIGAGAVISTITTHQIMLSVVNTSNISLNTITISRPDVVTDIHQYLFKYLHRNTKKYTTTTSGYIESSETLTNDTSFTEWTNICDPITLSPITFTGNRIANPVNIIGTFPIIYDSIKQIPYYPSTTYTANTSGDLVILAQKTGSDYVCELYSITSNNTINSTERQLSFSTVSPIISSSIKANKVSGLSYATINGDQFIFITESENIWYCNITANSGWNKLIDASTALYLDASFSLTTNANKVTYLSGLTGFNITQGSNGTLTGIFGSDLGYVQCNIINISGMLSLNVSTGLQFKVAVHSGIVRDLVQVYNKNNILSCGLETEPATGYIVPNTYMSPIKYYLYTPISNSNIPTTLSSSDVITTIIYKNYTSTQSPDSEFFNKDNIFYGTSNTDQFFNDIYINSTSVQANKQLISIPVYNDYTFPVTLDTNTLSYIKAVTKYQKLSLLIRVTESVILFNETVLMKSELIIPIVHEIVYQPI